MKHLVIETLKLIIRTIVIIIPVVILAFFAICRLIQVALNNLIDWIFGQTSYWDLSNEWFQVKEDALKWYRIWKTGGDINGDW